MRKPFSLNFKNFLISILVGLILISPVFNFSTFKITENRSPLSIVEASFLPTSVIITICGDGNLDPGEICDEGIDNGRYSYNAAVRVFCNTTCTGYYAPACGDGDSQSEYGEECDDGNNTSGDGCSSDCKTEAAPSPPPSGGGGGVTVPPPAPTKVIIKGKAYPLSSITILQDGRVAVATIADSQANFIAEITDITPGVWSFGVWAEDEAGRKSLTFTFTTSISKGVITTLSGIFLPPTIDLERTRLQRGETLNILGQTTPKSEVSIFIHSPGPEIIRKIEAEIDGTWFYPFDTTPLEEGSHTTRAKAQSPDELISTFSRTLAFNIGKEIVGVIKKADTNEDGRVNLVDFSILLYNWGVPKNPDVDLNSDGEVNLIDFSIMLYWWTG